LYSARRPADRQAIAARAAGVNRGGTFAVSPRKGDTMEVHPLPMAPPKPKRQAGPKGKAKKMPAPKKKAAKRK
jgi:hypothetical protein